MKKLPLLTVCCGVLAVLAYMLPGWVAALEFNRDALAEGQFWRLLTGHFTHFSAGHLRWDVLVFLALGSLVELRNRRHFIGCVAGSALLISLGVWWLQPQFGSYRGLSGLDSALFAYVAVDIASIALAERRLSLAVAAGFALLLFVAKLIFELISGRPVFVDDDAGFAPVPLAHLLGAVVGVGRTVGSNCFTPRLRLRVGRVFRNAPVGTKSEAAA